MAKVARVDSNNVRTGMASLWERIDRWKEEKAREIYSDR
jgi:hypothetical protein